MTTQGRAILTVRFGGGHIREQQQPCVLSQAAEEGQPTQQQLRLPLGQATTVEVEIGNGH